VEIIAAVALLPAVINSFFVTIKRKKNSRTQTNQKSYGNDSRTQNKVY